MRTGWDSYFMDIAHQAATRASCDRAKVGCVLVVDRQIIATGYNGR
jgi:dCMP deaminase